MANMETWINLNNDGVAQKNDATVTNIQGQGNVLGTTGNYLNASGMISNGNFFTTTDYYEISWPGTTTVPYTWTGTYGPVAPPASIEPKVDYEALKAEIRKQLTEEVRADIRKELGLGEVKDMDGILTKGRKFRDN